MTPILVTPPAVEPIGIVETRNWLRIESSAEDEIIGALIASARLVIETLTRRFLISQSWRLVFDAWPATGVMIPFSPVRSVVARVYDADGIASILPTQTYSLDQYRGDVRLRFLNAPPQPGRMAGGAEVDVEAGFATSPEDVPAPLRQAMRLLVARWYEHRGDVEADADMSRTPPSVAALVAPYRRMRLS